MLAHAPPYLVPPFMHEKKNGQHRKEYNGCDAILEPFDGVAINFKPTTHDGRRETNPGTSGGHRWVVVVVVGVGRGNRIPSAE